MSANWEITIGDFCFVSSINYIDPFWLTAFRESDRATEIRAGKALRRVPIPAYSAWAQTIATRLDFLGYSLSAIPREFARGLASERELHHAIEETRPLRAFGYDETQLRHVLPVLTHDRWRSALRRIVRGQRKKYDLARAMSPVQAVVNFILDNDEENFFLGAPRLDPLYILRAIVEMVPRDTVIRLEYRELIEWGTYRRSDLLVEQALSDLASRYAHASPAIVLTEGDFDRFVLTESLQLLHPALREYFAFINFAEDRVPGGAGNLVNHVKMLCATGIRNRIVGLLDNDTAAAAALRGLNRKKLPANATVTTLPELPFARQYPTIGPQGRKRANVNGNGCSIELFLGRDCLSASNNRLCPIRWTALERGTGKFQGELDNKALIQQRFRDKVASAQRDPNQLRLNTWDSLKHLWAHLIHTTLHLKC